MKSDLTLDKEVWIPVTVNPSLLLENETTICIELEIDKKTHTEVVYAIKEIDKSNYMIKFELFNGETIELGKRYIISNKKVKIVKTIYDIKDWSDKYDFRIIYYKVPVVCNVRFLDNYSNYLPNEVSVIKKYETNTIDEE